MCDCGKSPSLEKEKYVIWRGPNLSSQLFLLFQSWSLVHREWISSFLALGPIHYLPHYDTESFNCGVFPNSNSVRTGDTSQYLQRTGKLLGLGKTICLVSEVKGSRIKKTGGSPIYLPLTLCPKDAFFSFPSPEVSECQFCGKQYLLSRITEYMQPHFASIQTSSSLQHFLFWFFFFFF